MRLSFRALSGLRVTGLVLLLGVVAALGVAYTLFVAQQTRYLESRNFRLLQSLGAQTEGALRNEVRVFESQAREFREQTWTHIKDRRYGGTTDLPDKLIKMDAPESWFGFAARQDAYVLALTLSDSAKATPRPVTRLALPLASILEPIFRPKIRQSAFDTVVLASEDGEVWLAVGARADELKAGRLDALVVPPAKGPPRPFAQLVHTSVVPLAIGGVAYKLFAQPCCRLPGNTKNMLVAGLIDADALGARSRAIPTTLIKLAVLAVLAVLVFWPFLKLMLLGGTQRIRALDVLQIGVSCVAAPGLLTIALLDFYADRRLQQDQDRDLANLAVSIDGSFTAEITAAAQQLSCLEDVTRDLVPGTGAELEQDAIGNALALNIRRTGLSSCAGTLDELPELSRAGGGSPPSTRWPYPYFESFSLIGPDGMQRVKLATTRWVSSRISVRERRYFKDVQSKALWKHPKFCPKDKGCTLESVMSWTTGEAQAVLATTAFNPCQGRGEGCKPDFAVAALSMTLRSLAQPILPPGFEFAVIDDSGIVYFHSDPQRNGYENFLEETDGNRRLRAQILANSTAPLDLRYWGAPYRGYVRPLGPFGLTLVTLLQQEQTWALNREWLVVAVLFFGGYMLLCAVALLITLASNPSWLWPDAARASRYPIVIALNVGLFLAALAALRLWEGTTLVWCACLIPLAAWAGTFSVLRTRSAEAPTATFEPVHAHRAALVLLLVVSGVAPALLMFVASFQLHMQTYVKHGQFRVAQALVQRQERLEAQHNPKRGAQRQTLLARIGDATDRYQDLYYDFFYDTCVRAPSTLSGTSRCPPALANQQGPYAAEPGQGGDDLLALLETYLPYYSESSVEWRELLHSRAGDGSWRSSMNASGVLTTTLPASSSETVTLSSNVPRLAGSSRQRPVSPPVVRAGAWLGASTTYFLLAGLGLIVVALVRQLVVFVSRQILLTGVTEPLWSRLKVTANAGDNLFVLCDTATRERQVAGAQPLRLGPLARKPHMEAALRQELLRLGRTDRGEALLIDDFDDDVENGALMDRKLTLLERLATDRSRAVVVLSQLSPTALADSVRRSSKAPASTAITADRWQLLTNAFVITDWRRRAEPGTGVTKAAAEGDGVAPDRAIALMASLRPTVRALLSAEGKSHPLIGRICERLARSEAVIRGELSDEQLLEEIAEQAATCYRRLWSACSADERIVLVHLAQDGLTHAGARPAVRKLLARKLLRKAPDLRLMNQTFRLFVLSPACCAEVARLEATTEPSVWDNLRIPLGIAVLGAAAFLVATQRELYEALLGATTAAAVSVPAIVRAVSVLAGRRPHGDEKLA